MDMPLFSPIIITMVTMVGIITMVTAIMEASIMEISIFGVLLCRKDAFTGKQYLQEGIKMEQASVLFNLG